MLVIGLTGGIGSGKTTVAKLFSERGITVIDTDQLSRDVTKPGSFALEKITHRFGPTILQSNGSLNRTELRKKIFKDDPGRIWLEQLLHPLIREEMKAQAEHATSPYVIAVIPLLLESEKNPLINRVLVVDTSEEDQLKRTQLRDNSTVDEVKAIIKAQVSRITRLQKADDIIENKGNVKDLIPQIDRLHDFYVGLSQNSSS